MKVDKVQHGYIVNKDGVHKVPEQVKWEKEFDKYYKADPQYIHTLVTPDEIKAFISKLLKQRDEKIIKIIRKSEWPDGYIDMVGDELVKKIKSLIKGK